MVRSTGTGAGYNDDRLPLDGPPPACCSEGAYRPPESRGTAGRLPARLLRPFHWALRHGVTTRGVKLAPHGARARAPSGLLHPAALSMSTGRTPWQWP